jgi:hypothetical protein
MATKVSINTSPGHRIGIKNMRVRAQVSSALGVGGGGATTLQQLTDVDLTGKANNDVLVYDENTNKFISTIIPLVDGGEF